ncbi:nitroreductase [Candidatus Pacearchaeota archaeon CG10_big_fil_rev_8_21_14_0_10_34_12]|nr:MAG: nitroreductase [Candidatus Pacearchaeota archaeon CG10_big_fil_rev_8_21_14_0_10_34_12]
MDLDKVIQGRKSTRKFSDKKPDWREIIECIDSFRFAPMAGNIFSLKIVLIDDKNKINVIAEAAQQNFISQAKYVVVVCSQSERTIASYGKKGKIYLNQQAGAAIENFLLKVEEKKLATCWVGHFNERQIKEILKIPENVNIEAIFPIGYASKLLKQGKKRKISMDEILYFNKYKNKRMGK